MRLWIGEQGGHVRRRTRGLISEACQRRGKVLSSQVWGQIKCNARLTGLSSPCIIPDSRLICACQATLISC